MGKPKGRREWGGVAAAMETGSRKRQCTLGVGAEEQVLIPIEILTAMKTVAGYFEKLGPR